MFTCKVEFDGYDWRNEISVQSPKTGRTIHLTSNGNWQRVSEEVVKFFRFLNDAYVKAKFGIGRQKTTYSLSKNALEELLSLAR